MGVNRNGLRVKDLIEELSKLDPEAYVCADDVEWGTWVLTEVIPKVSGVIESRRVPEGVPIVKLSFDSDMSKGELKSKMYQCLSCGVERVIRDDQPLVCLKCPHVPMMKEVPP